VVTRRLRFGLCQYHRYLKGQALAQESAAEHLIGLADTLGAVGRSQDAKCLVSVALRLWTKAIYLSAQAQALDWRRGILV
jgi:hypothetical protein